MSDTSAQVWALGTPLTVDIGKPEPMNKQLEKINPPIVFSFKVIHFCAAFLKFLTRTRLEFVHAVCVCVGVCCVWGCDSAAQASCKCCNLRCRIKADRGCSCDETHFDLSGSGLQPQSGLLPPCPGDSRPSPDSHMVRTPILFILHRLMLSFSVGVKKTDKMSEEGRAWKNQKYSMLLKVRVVCENSFNYLCHSSIYTEKSLVLNTRLLHLILFKSDRNAITIWCSVAGFHPTK